MSPLIFWLVSVGAVAVGFWDEVDGVDGEKHVYTAGVEAVGFVAVGVVHDAGASFFADAGEERVGAVERDVVVRVRPCGVGRGSRVAAARQTEFRAACVFVTHVRLEVGTWFG